MLPNRGVRCVAILGKYLAKKSRKHHCEPFGRPLWLISTALSLIDVEQLYQITAKIISKGQQTPITKKPTNVGFLNYLGKLINLDRIKLFD